MSLEVSPWRCPQHLWMFTFRCINTSGTSGDGHPGGGEASAMSAMLLPRGPPTLDHRLWPRRQWPILGETGWKLGEDVGRCWRFQFGYESTFKTQGPQIFGYFLLLLVLTVLTCINHQIWCNNRDPILTRTQFGVNGWYPKMVQNYWEKKCFTSGSW